jgi:hypothetical protein
VKAVLDVTGIGGTGTGIVWSKTSCSDTSGKGYICQKRQNVEEVGKQSRKTVDIFSDRKLSVSAEIVVSVCISVSVSINLLVSVAVSVQTKPKFRYFGFGLNLGFVRSLAIFTVEVV